LAQYLAFLVTIVLLPIYKEDFTPKLTVFWVIYQTLFEAYSFSIAKKFGVTSLDTWNILDYSRILCMISYNIGHFTENNGLESASFSLTILFAWISLLQYLKIFKEFRYLSELIVECIFSAGEFMFVVVILIVGFSLAIYSRNRMQNGFEDQTFGSNFLSIFMNAFGDFGLLDTVS
jgi:hypothetical protein